MSRLPYTPRRTPAPPAPPDFTAQMRRWTFLIIGGTVLVAGGFIGVQLYLLKSVPKAPDEETPTRPAWALSMEDRSARPLPAPRDPHPADASPKADADETLLGVVGTLTFANLYQTDLNIGLLADAV